VPTTPETTTIVLATRNPGKLREMRSIMAGAPVELVSADSLDAPDVEETGETFEENAALKATAVARATGHLAIADDSGLSVDALDGAPGVRSARYSEEGTDAANNEKLLRVLDEKGLVRAAARFVCVMALASPDELLESVRGEVEGEIVPGPQGSGGFGYDPIFHSPELGKTFGSATPEEKEGVSHRGKALRKLRSILLERLG